MKEGRFYIFVFFKLALVLLVLLPCKSFSHPIDGIEHLFGATNINAACGNGGLTAGISKEGEITVLRWPSPSYYDQLNYRTEIVGVNEGYHARELKHMGARDDMGAFAGVFLRASGSGYSRMLWFRDTDAWDVKQYYLTDSDNIVVNEYSLKITEFAPLRVTQEIFVVPEKDLLVIHLKGNVPSNLNTGKVIFYANLAPTVTKKPYVPLSDWIDDSLNDFAAVYDPETDAIIQFNYQGSDLNDLLNYVIAFPAPNSDEVTGLLKDLDSLLGGKESVVIATSFIGGNDSYQIGFDMSTGCPDSRYDPYLEEPAYIPISAYVSAEQGLLMKQMFGHCAVNFAISKDIGQGEELWDATIVMAFAGSYQEAKDLLEWARDKGYTDLISRTEKYWRDWISSARLPETEDPDIIAFSKRALISVKTATDRLSDAVVASISTQPPYNLDWPRDGAFINAAMDVAGYHQFVTDHNYFYTSVQRKEHQALRLVTSNIDLAGTFEMNYYADGTPGGPILFEVDETGLALWTFWQHAKFIPDGTEREEYIKTIYPNIMLAARSLLRCRDEETGLQCWAFEDDTPYPTRRLQGAVTVYGGLETALEAAEYFGESGEFMNNLKARLTELRTAIRTYLYDEESGEFKPSPRLKEIDRSRSWNLMQDKNPGAQAWLIWPFGIFQGEEEERRQAEKMLDDVKAHLEGKTEGFAYLAKELIALARFYKDDPEKFSEVKDLANILLKDVPTHDTHHMGEVVASIDLNGDGIADYFDNRVAIPHVWEQTLGYLLAMAIYSPDSLQPFEEKLVKAPSCACSQSGGDTGTSLINACFLMLIFLAFYFTSIFRLKRRSFISQIEDNEGGI